MRAKKNARNKDLEEIIVAITKGVIDITNLLVDNVNSLVNNLNTIISSIKSIINTKNVNNEQPITRQQKVLN